MMQKEKSSVTHNKKYSKAHDKLRSQGAGINPILLVIGSLILGSVVLALSCAPAAFEGNGNTQSTAAGAVTGLSVTSIGGTSFDIQWNASTDTGTKPDGTELTPEELVYRVYYIAETADQADPMTVEYIKQSSGSLRQELTEGVTSATITELSPETLYYVTVASYNSFAGLETDTTEIAEARTTAAFAPGAVTGISVTSIGGTSFDIQWNAPTETGIKEDGTELTPEELVYRVYYLAGTVDQDAPTAESLRQNTDAQTQELTGGVTSTTITELLPETRYFVTVVSYNSFAQLETLSDEVVTTSTGANIADFDGTLKYEDTHGFSAGTSNTITPLTRATIPVTDVNGSINYALAVRSGTGFTPPPIINGDGTITVRPISAAGTATYVVQASATGYVTQYAIVTISILDLSTAPGAISGLTVDTASVESGSFDIQWNAPVETGTKIDGTALTPDEVSYRIYYLAGTVGQNAPIAESLRQHPNAETQELTGLSNTSATIVALAPDTRYFVTVVSYNSFAELERISDEVVEASTVANITNLVGNLSYDLAHSFFVGTVNSITPLTRATIPVTETSGVDILYSLTRREGTVFNLEPIINEDNGVITILQASNAGTATYIVQASADGYNAQVATLEITIMETNFDGLLAYDSHSSSVGTDDSITPSLRPTLLSTDNRGVAIRYTIERRGDPVFDSEPSINEDDGVITILQASNAGTATYDVQVSAAGYITQVATLEITIVEAYFEGTLEYEDTYRFAVGSLNPLIVPLSIPTLQSTDMSGKSISYTIARTSGTEFDLEPSINGDGIITIPQIGQAGTATYAVQASAAGYVTATATLEIIVVEANFGGDELLYDDAYTLSASNNSIVPLSIPTLQSTDTSGKSISYTIAITDGAEQLIPPSIDGKGDITFSGISIEGEATYVIKALAEGYVTQEATITVTVTLLALDGDLLYDNAYTLSASNNAPIAPSSIPTVPTTDIVGSTIQYTLEKTSGAGFVPPTIDDEGVITFSGIYVEGTATYVIKALAGGYVTKEATITVTITTSVLDGSLMYDDATLSVIDNAPIAPSSIPTVPMTDTIGTTIRYSFTRTSGTVFDPQPTINVEDGVISFRRINNTGTATYRIRTYAEGYVLQEATIDITVAEADLEGDLVYDDAYDILAGVENSIAPRSRPTVPTGDTVDTTIRYSITRTSGSISNFIFENNGVITITPSSTGTANFLVHVSAKGYVTKEARFAINTVANTITTTSYYSGARSSDQIIGPSAEDSGTFSFEDDDVLLTIYGVTVGEVYTIKFGEGGSAFSDSSVSYQKTGVTDVGNDGLITVLKSELRENLSSFTLKDGTLIGIEGPGIAGTKLVATYRPSNIYSAQDLQAMRVNLSGNYLITRDVVFPYLGASTSNFEPIGGDSNPFTGTLTGSNNTITITGIRIEAGSQDRQGLFGVINGASSTTVVVERLALEGFNIKGGDQVGSLAGELRQGVVQYVHVRASDRVTVSGADGGGLVGLVEADASVLSSSATINVFGGNSTGGLVGRANANAVVTGNATGNVSGGAFIGGLVGLNSGATVTGYATGAVTGTDSTGGLVGRVNANAVVTGNATGSVSGGNHTGGLVGYNEGTTVIKGYATGNVIGTDRVGGLVGFNEGTVYGYARGNVSGDGRTGGLIGNNTSTGTVEGYARGVVRKLSGGNIYDPRTFGRTIGDNDGTAETYHSSSESQLYQGATGTLGFSYTPYGDNGFTTTTAQLSSYTHFYPPFNPAVWAFANGRWPAIIDGFTLTADQPTNP